MKKTASEGNIWVYTVKAEEYANELLRAGKDVGSRKAGTPAMLGYDVCGDSVSMKWFELGYVEEAKVDLLDMRGY